MPKGYSDYAQRTGRTLAEKLAFYTDRSAGPDGCWIWNGAKHRSGPMAYGNVSWRGVQTKAHRAAWEVANEQPIPNGMQVCHRCDVRLCVNPAHLFIGTPADNSADMARKGRSARGERSGNAKLTTSQVLALKADPRPQKDIAELYGIGRPNVSHIKKSKGWRHLW